MDESSETKVCEADGVRSVVTAFLTGETNGCAGLAAAVEDGLRAAVCEVLSSTGGAVRVDDLGDVWLTAEPGLQARSGRICDEAEHAFLAGPVFDLIDRHELLLAAHQTN